VHLDEAGKKRWVAHSVVRHGRFVINVHREPLHAVFRTRGCTVRNLGLLFDGS
jgi:hypothetical protein